MITFFSPWLPLEILFGVVLLVFVRYCFGRRLGPRACRWLWILVMLRALVPVTISLPYHPLSCIQSPVQSSHIQNPDIQSPNGHGAETPIDRSVTVAAPNGTTLNGEAPNDTAFSGRYILYGIWFAVFTLILLTAFVRNRRMIRRATRFPTPVPDWVQTIFLESREALRLGTWPVLIVSPCVPTPCLVGALRPRILLPETLLEEFSDRDSVRFVILHEMVHLKSGDIWFSWLWTLTLAVHWFNPLFWILGRYVTSDCEAACDDRVLSELHGSSRPEYAAALLKIMKLLNPPPIRTAGLSAVIETSSNLERRFKMMTLHRTPTLRGFLAACVVLTSLAALSLTGRAEPAKPISEEKAKMIGYVEDFLMNNFRDVTMRKSLEWGDVKNEKNGNRTIRYRCEALIWDKDRKTCVWDFTFDKEGKYVSHQNVEGFPKDVVVEKPDPTAEDGIKKLVEKFFTQNYIDISSRKTIEWGDFERVWSKDTHDRVYKIRYEYEAIIRGKDVLHCNKIWTFSEKGEFISVEDVAGFPKKKETSDSSAKTNDNSEAKPGKIDTKGSQRAASAGWRFFMQGKPDEAEPKFQEAVKLNPKNANAYQGLGWAQTNMQMYEDAKETFAKCLELDPKNAAALNGLGVIARKEGNEKTMVDVWLRGVEADKNATGPMAGLAGYYEKKDDKKNAAKYYKMWLDAEPDNTEAKAGVERTSNSEPRQ